MVGTSISHNATCFSVLVMFRFPSQHPKRWGGVEVPPLVKKLIAGKDAFSGKRGQYILAPISAINGSTFVDDVVRYDLMIELVSAMLINVPLYSWVVSLYFYPRRV